jgi:hypothetical protein
VDSRFANDSGTNPSMPVEPAGIALNHLRRKSGGPSLVVVVLIVLGFAGAVGAGVVAAVFGFGAVVLSGQAEQTKQAAAKAQAKVIEAAVVQYHLIHDEEPGTLDVLAQPDADNGSQPYLSASQLIDPWGKAFCFDPNGPHHQGDKPDIYAVSRDGTKVGNW